LDNPFENAPSDGTVYTRDNFSRNDLASDRYGMPNIGQFGDYSDHNFHIVGQTRQFEPWEGVQAVLDP